jgi:tetratricopeptide (TPR) repeat protein
MLAQVLYSLGYPDQALRRVEEALAMARVLGHPYTLAWVLGSMIGVLLRRGDYREAKELAEERVAFCAQHGFSSELSEATVHYGFILVQVGCCEDGVAQMREGLAADSRTRTNQVRLLEQYLLARALAKIGRTTEASAIIAALLCAFEQTSENSSMKPDIFTLNADLLSNEGQSRWADAADNYRRAIALARQNSDKIAELEATTRLARLLDQQGRRDEARAMLAEIYNWFTEGFDTPDLKDAKTLLNELGA